MTADQIIDRLSLVHQFKAGCRIDVETYPNGSFLAIEVEPDLTVLRRFVGYIRSDGGVVSTREPDLTLDQFRIFEALSQTILGRIMEGEQREEADISIINEGEHSDIFDYTLPRFNIAGNVVERMLPIWHAADDLLMQMGYRCYSRHHESGELREIRVRHRDFPI